MNRNALFFTTLLLALGAVLPAQGDDITLKRSVRIRHDDGAILLRDVARIEGAHAMRFAEVQLAIFTDRTRPIEIGVNDVAIALERAGANRALFDLSGSRVIVRPYARANPATAGPEACTPLKLNGEVTTEAATSKEHAPPVQKELKVIFNPRTVIGEDTPRGLIADRFAPQWRDLDDPVRIRIETRQPDLLSARDARPTVTAIGTTSEGVVSFRIDLAGKYAGSVVATLETKTIVHRARADLKRGDRVDLDDIKMRSEWMPFYRMQAIATTAAMIGMTLESRIAADTIIEPTHFAPIVRRNEPIMVRSGGEGWSMMLDCIALEDGRLGDLIEVRTNRSGLAEREAKPILVVVEDANHATLLN